MAGSNERDLHAESTAVMRKDQLSELLDEEPEQLALTMPIAASQLQSLLADERILPERPQHKFAPLVKSTSTRMSAVQPVVEVTIVPDDDDDDDEDDEPASADEAVDAALADGEAEATVLEKQPAAPDAAELEGVLTTELDPQELTRLLDDA